MCVLSHTSTLRGTRVLPGLNNLPVFSTRLGLHWSERVFIATFCKKQKHIWVFYTSIIWSRHLVNCWRNKKVFKILKSITIFSLRTDFLLLNWEGRLPIQVIVCTLLTSAETKLFLGWTWENIVSKAYCNTWHSFFKWLLHGPSAELSHVWGAETVNGFWGLDLGFLLCFLPSG